MKSFVQPLCALLLVGIVCSTGEARACTGIRLQAKDGAIVYARTLEFGFDLQSSPIVIPRNYRSQGTTASGNPGLVWKSRFGVAGLNGLGLPVVIDGVNEKGLASGTFYMPGYAEYQSVSPQEEANSIAPWEVVTWILTNFATVNEVRSALPEIRVGKVAYQGVLHPLHYVVHDAEGNSLVIEYLDGKLSLNDNPIGVITNSPEFAWHITNLSNYVNLSPQNARPEHADGVTIQPLGQGSGLFGLPGDFTPPSRFVRAVALSQSAVPGADGPQTVGEAFHILDSFDIPLGTVRSGHAGDATFEYTQWTGASDTKNRVYYFHTYGNRRVQKVELDNVDLDAPQVLTIPKHAAEDVQNLTPSKAGA